MRVIKCAMTFPLKFSIILLITTGFTTTAKDVMNFIQISQIFREMCGRTAVSSTVQPCAEEFEKTVRPYMANFTLVMDEYGFYRPPNTHQEGHIFPHCCAISTLRYCLVENIGTACGDDGEVIVDFLVDEIVAAIKVTSGRQPCDGNEFYFRNASPLCWHFWGQLTGIALVAVLLITTSCCCCICSCLLYCRPKRQTKTYY